MPQWRNRYTRSAQTRLASTVVSVRSRPAAPSHRCSKSSPIEDAQGGDHRIQHVGGVLSADQFDHQKGEILTSGLDQDLDGLTECDLSGGNAP